MRCLNRILSEKNGMTIMEVIIALVLLSIVGMAIFSFMEYGIVSFRYSNEKVDEMAVLRKAAYTVSDEVRNAFKAEVNDFGDALVLNPADLTDRIYHNGIMVVHDNGSVQRNLTSDIVTDAQFTIVKKNDKYILELTLESDKTDIVTEILLNNITVEGDPSTDTTVDIADQLLLMHRIRISFGLLRMKHCVISRNAIHLISSTYLTLW